MNTLTRLEPLAADRARELQELLRRASDDEATALSLDEGGHVKGLVAADSPQEHLLGDLDVHA
jgi:hypothetical protein